MKKLWFVYFILFIPFSLFSEIDFPDSAYMVDVDTGFKIMLGLPPSFAEREYGVPKEKEMRSRHGNGREYWSMTYDNFEIWYEAKDMMITDFFVTNQKFRTPKGVKVGDSMSSIVKTYGNPTPPGFVHKNAQGELFYVYRKSFRELNHEEEYIAWQFVFVNDKVIRIILTIMCDV